MPSIVEDAKLLVKLDEVLSKGTGVYVWRDVLNPDQLLAWAASQGIPNLVPAEELHVTQVYSRDPVELLLKYDGVIISPEAILELMPLGDKGALVLRLESKKLSARFDETRAAGATWDYPTGYKPHVTLSYDAGGFNPAEVTFPDFPLLLGPECSEPLNENWAEETGLRKQWSEDQHPRDKEGRWTDAGGGQHEAHEVHTDPSDRIIAAVQAKIAGLPLTLKVKAWRRVGNYKTREFNIETTTGNGFAQLLVWQGKDDAGQPLFTLQQHDVSLPEALRGSGLGGKMVGALAAAIKASGASEVPIHVNVNESFWDHMKAKHKGVWKAGWNEEQHPRDERGRFGAGTAAGQKVKLPIVRPRGAGGRYVPHGRQATTPAQIPDSRGAASYRPLGGGVTQSVIVEFNDGSKGVYKPASGEDTGDIKRITGIDNYMNREALASDIADIVGMHDLVPQTEIRADLKDGIGSVQRFVENAVVAHKVQSDQMFGESIHDMMRAAAFDFVLGNGDRHAGNWMVTPADAANGRQPKLVLIDNGISMMSVDRSLRSNWNQGIRKKEGLRAWNKSMTDDHLPHTVTAKWAGKWPQLEKAMKAQYISQPAIDLAHKRFRFLTEKKVKIRDLTDSVSQLSSNYGALA